MPAPPAPCRLFSAIELPAEVGAHLAAALAALPAEDDVRPTARHQWHITVGFYGDHDDPASRTATLREAVAGLAAPALRLAGSGRFSGVLWVGVAADLAPLAAAAGTRQDALPFHPHVTVARWRRGSRCAEAARTLAGYRGPQWTADALTLVRSDLTAAGPVYTPVVRLPLGGARI